MHRGVRTFLKWVTDHADTEHVDLRPPASTADLGALERVLGGPLPTDLRFVLARFNGGTLPTVKLLPAGRGPGTIEAAVRSLAESLGADFLDPELLLPFGETDEGSVLAFDRSAGPVSDTWPVVDYYEDTGDQRLVHRTFDGWCAKQVADWSAPEFGGEFTLDAYLRLGRRHAEVEPDVATPHATVAHALRRAGQPEAALAAYLTAARCVPALPWCDWEALKLAVLLDHEDEAYESASRLCARAPADAWSRRETTAGRVAEVVGQIALGAMERGPWVRLLDQLASLTPPGEERDVVKAVRKGVLDGALPLVRPLRPQSVVPPQADLDSWWQAVRGAYIDGRLRDDDLLLDPNMVRLGVDRSLDELLRLRREF